MSKRKFYKTIIELEVLSESPVGDSDMEEINYQINEGDWSGIYRTKIQDKKVSSKEIVELLLEQGSDSEFFRLDNKGNDLQL